MVYVPVLRRAAAWPRSPEETPRPTLPLLITKTNSSTLAPSTWARPHQTGNADFFVLLNGGGAGSAAKVDAVKFVSGDEKLKSYTEALRTADYHLTFPDDTPVKVFRRGTLSCSMTTGKCNFVLTLPDDVRTVD